MVLGYFFETKCSTIGVDCDFGRNGRSIDVIANPIAADAAVYGF